ncbi:MAG: TonB-dependent receptor [Gammaproteobacteria bacterium]|nr:TonB-dependent receptor [Gammaproteobacteria bacterium]
MNDAVNDTYHKALALNMDKNNYGTIAEIGAGQETARWFFKVGGAAGSIAKALSAYDMQFSDSIYGTCQRYVSRERLHSMLKTEYNLLDKRLSDDKASGCTFFSFANTVTTFNYAQQRSGHGWLGIRFQTCPHEMVSEIHLHVALKGSTNTLDQTALGILGVNLIYGAHYKHRDSTALLTSLMDNLSTNQLEIDMIDFNGPAFKQIDNRLMALKLVQLGLTHAAMFQSDGKLVQPAEALYKKAVLIERSRFRPPTKLNIDLLDCAYEAFCNETDVNRDEVIVLSEMTLQNLTYGDDINIEDFLQRIDILCALGKNVMISNYAEFYRLAQYLFEQTNKPVAIALGVPTLRQIFNEKYYENLDGGILEAFGRLFRNDMRLYVCPSIQTTGELTTMHDLKVQKHLQHLYSHLIENKFIRNLDTVDQNNLSIHADAVFEKIRNGDASWQTQVPQDVANIINERGLFKQGT